MKTTFTMLLIVTLTFSSSVFANNDPVLTSLEGGRLELNLSAASKLLAGSGVASVSTSGVVATRSDPFAVFSNPASWQIVRDGATVGISIQPHLSINTLPNAAHSSLDSHVDGVLSGFSQSEDVQKPELAGSMARSSTIVSGFSVIVPWNEWRFGLGYTKPVQADLTISHDGLSQQITQAGDTPDESLAMSIEAIANANLNMNSNRWLVGAARTIDKWSVGLSLSRTDVSVSVSGGYEVNGGVEFGGENHSFNDSADPWHNSFAGNASGSYEGSIYTMQSGLNYQLGNDRETAWTVGANVSLNFGQTLTGGMSVSIDEYLPLELSPIDGTDAFDIARLSDPVELTRTYEKTYDFGNELTLETPHVFSVGIAKPNGLRPNLNLTAYAGNLAYHAQVTESHVEDEETTTGTYARGIDPLGSVYLGISPGAFFLGGGATWVKDMAEGYNGANGEELSGGSTVMIPRIDLGMILPLSAHLRAELLMVALPEDAVRIGVIYEF